MSLPRKAVHSALQHIHFWFQSKGWQPFDFQKRAWKAWLDGQSGLIHSTTGTGKTLAALLGPVIEALAERESRMYEEAKPTSLRVLWITPLRALAADTVKALQQPVLDLGIDWQVESRTSDTTAAIRQRQKLRLPEILVTTPESLSLLLTRSDAESLVKQLRLVVCDEWHELVGSKRGVQVQLALTRLRRWSPEIRTWGLSATLGNLQEANVALLGVCRGVRISDKLPADVAGESRSSGKQCLIRGHHSRKVVIDSLIPGRIDRFPWAGHMGLQLLPDVVREVETARSSLIFTNTRSQTEAWYQSLLQSRPEWAGQIALHHGSLDPETRTWVEQGLRDGRLKTVVCTSSLDLGVDFSPVDRVFQVGSPKGVARLLQRAGRSGHQPGAVSRVTCVPSHALELIEVAAARDAVRQGFIESRQAPILPLDVLCQHVVTIALGTGFETDDLLNEIRQTVSFQTLTRTEWQWIVDFVAHGGEALRAYPDYHKLELVGDRYVVNSPRISRQHRMSIGTIVGDAALAVQYLSGGRLGTIEESFVTRLHPGDCFVFAGRTLELVSVHDMTVWVRRASASVRARVPRWMGGRMPLSTELAASVQRKFQEAESGIYRDPEMRAVRPLMELQSRWSVIPLPGQLLIECVKSREGFHTFFYPFAGRLVHEGLSALFAWRMAQRKPMTFSMSVNDYGFELLSHAEPPLIDALDAGLLATDNLATDVEHCCNAAEMGKRQFREIARISGLVFQGYPGSQKSARQLQASSGLLYDVFSNYDTDNLLLQQSRREVLERQLEHSRLVDTLNRLGTARLSILRPARFTPLAFPLLVERLRERMSSETLVNRIARMQLTLERAAGYPS